MEHPENNEKPPMDQKSKVKFKIMSLKVKKGADYVPELVSFINLNAIFILFMEKEAIYYIKKGGEIPSNTMGKEEISLAFVCMVLDSNSRILKQKAMVIIS